MLPIGRLPKPPTRLPRILIAYRLLVIRARQLVPYLIKLLEELGRALLLQLGLVHRTTPVAIASSSDALAKAREVDVVPRLRDQAPRRALHGGCLAAPSPSPMSHASLEPETKTQHARTRGASIALLLLLPHPQPMSKRPQRTSKRPWRGWVRRRGTC